MRAIIGALVAIGVGFILGALAVTYMGTNGQTAPKQEPPKADVETSAYFICSMHISDNVKDVESPLIIKSTNNVAISMICQTRMRLIRPFS
jgi:amino acid transporter